MPFLYFSYLFHAFLVICIPMTARKGTEVNPDLLIALLCALGTILALGFLVSRTTKNNYYPSFGQSASKNIYLHRFYIS